MEILELKNFLKSLPKLNDKDSSARVSKAKGDFAFFVATYLGHHIGLDGAKKHKETSEFRKWVYESLPNLVSPNKKGEVSLSYFRGCEVASKRSALVVRERSEHKRGCVDERDNGRLRVGKGRGQQHFKFVWHRH